LPGAQAVVIEQTSIDLWPATHTHRRDPRTSFAAAERVERTGAAQRHMDMIVDALTRLGGAGTSREISTECGLDYMQVVRRMSDLVANGVVEDYSCLPRNMRPSKDGYTLWRLK
jgi:predicted transcriptional regulator